MARGSGTGRAPETYPDSTPSTRFSIKKEPMMMRGMKYNQFQVFPEASLLCGRGGGKAGERSVGLRNDLTGGRRGSLPSHVLGLRSPGALAAQTGKQNTDQFVGETSEVS